MSLVQRSGPQCLGIITANECRRLGLGKEINNSKEEREKEDEQLDSDKLLLTATYS